MKKIFTLVLFFSLCSVSRLPGEVVFRNSGIITSKEAGIRTPQEHYYTASKAMECSNWRIAEKNFSIITKYFPKSEYAPESHFYAGVCLYELKEFELANKNFNNYMKEKNSPKFFEEALQYKFCIAEQFRAGVKRRPFGTREFFKFLSGERISLNVYDEVIAALPGHDLAARSLFSKGALLHKIREYRESIEAYQTLIRRFPKHELTPESYINITKIYLDLSKVEFQNPDIVSLAEVTVKKFAMEFPGDERVIAAQQCIPAITEVYAQGLFDTGQFYERKYKSKASVIYYENAIRQFPNTEIAQLCRERLKALAPCVVQALDTFLIKTLSESEAAEPLGDINFEEIDFSGM